MKPALLLEYSEGVTLDPYDATGQASMALLDESMATASIMGYATRTPAATS